MHIKNKLLRLIVVMMLLVTTISGCLGDSKKLHNSPNLLADRQKLQDENSDVSKGASWTWDTSPLTINWFVAEDGYSKEWDTTNSLLDRMITEDTGIKINFDSGNDQKLSALIASGDLPDVVTAWYILPQIKLLEQSGMVYSLNKLITEYAPDFNPPQSMIDWYTAEDGEWYGFPNYFYAQEQLKEGENIPTHTMIRARQDIMDDLGILPDDFNTKEGTITALKKVRDSNYQYNGHTVIPAYYDYWNLVQFFGGAREDENGNYVDREREPEMLEALKFLNQLYREGLMPEDSQTLSRDQIQQKVNEGRVFSYTGSLIRPDSLMINDPNALMVHVGPVKGDNGNEFYFDPSAVAGWTLSMITKNAKRPDRIIRLFEYLYQDEMCLNVYHGPQGYAWEYTDDGKIRYTEQRRKDFAEDYSAAQLKYGNEKLIWLINWIPIIRTWPVPNMPGEKAIYNAEQYFNQFSYNDLAFSTVNPQGGSEEARIQAKIDEFREMQYIRMILADSEEEVEKIFYSMPEQEAKLGYDKLYAYKNAQFKVAKKKLGIEFAWPGNMK